MNHEYAGEPTNPLDFLVGQLIGGLATAGALTLLKLRSGKRTQTMTNEYDHALDVNQHDEAEGTNPQGFLAWLLLGGLVGLLLGGLAGAGAMLLLAPQSGKKTRAKIQRKGRDLRNQTADTIEDVEDALADTRVRAHKVTKSMHKQADDLQKRGQDMVEDGKAYFTTTVEAGKAAIHNS